MSDNLRTEWKTVVWLWLAGFGLRVLHYWLFAGELIADGDQIKYITLGRRLAAGDLYGFLDVYWAPVYPLLIGIVSCFVDALVLPALIVSVTAGSFVVPLTYLFARQFYGPREAIIAAVLAVFYPHLLNEAVFELGVVTIYLLWIIGALLVGWSALQNRSVTACLLTGILFGLAYLTRPEAIAYPFYLAALIVIKNRIDSRPLSGRVLQRVGVLLLGFAVCAAPYLLYLKSETGSWTVSAKFKANVASGVISEDREKAVGTKLGGPAATVRMILKEIPFSLIETHKNLPHLLPIFLMTLIGLGLFGSAWGKPRLERETYLILFCLVTVLGYAATVVQTRYFYILLPIFFGWIAAGIIRLQHWFEASNFLRRAHGTGSLHHKNLFVALILVVIYVYVFPLNYFINKRDTAFEGRDAGLWLKENGRPAPLIFSASTLPVFYAEGSQLLPEETDKEQMLEQIKRERPDYVITNERAIARNPHFEELDELLEDAPDFELIYRQNENKKNEISIYKVK